jgi:hypothetical protein
VLEHEQHVWQEIALPGVPEPFLEGQGLAVLDRAQVADP